MMLYLRYNFSNFVVALSRLSILRFYSYSSCFFFFFSCCCCCCVAHCVCYSYIYRLFFFSFACSPNFLRSIGRLLCARFVVRHLDRSRLYFVTVLCLSPSLTATVIVAAAAIINFFSRELFLFFSLFLPHIILYACMYV